MKVKELRSLLEQISDQTASADWLSQLPERKRSEIEFHNLYRANGEQTADVSAAESPDTQNKKYYSVTRTSRKYVDEWLTRHVPGKVFLDYACGDGSQAINAAQKGAGLVIGLDISDVSVANARRHAAAAGVSDRCVFVQGDCEATGLPDQCIDLVLCSGMLHHLDLSFALPELRRILKPEGTLLAVEALDYNPAIKAYRLMTPGMRTEWEKHHILSLADLKFAKRFFDLGEIRYWHLFALGAVGLRRFEALFKPTLRALEAMDSIAMRIPGLRLMAWQFTFELVRRADV